MDVYSSDEVKTRTAITESMKKQMAELNIDWSLVVQQATKRRLEGDHQTDVIEALLLNEKLRKKAPEGWNSATVIRTYRRRR